MRRYRGIRFGDSPKGAQMRKLIRNMDNFRRPLYQALPTIWRAIELLEAVNRANPAGGSMVNTKKLKDELEQLKLEYKPNYGRSLEDDLDGDNFFEDL